MSSLTDKIEAIRARADVLRVIGDHVQLKKQGRSFVGRCPFHSEKSPSFSVSPDKGLYYCFGCHASGDVFKFVEQVNGVDFLGAVRLLAKQFGVEVEPETPEQAKRRKLETGVADCNTYAHAFFKHALWSKGGERARAYLEERGIPENQAHERGLGFGGEPGELLAYLERKNVKRELAAKAGLLNEAGDRCLFDERLMFPIVDQHGRIAGFGGRWMGATSGPDGERLRPKYVNTRESALFSKRTLLYGWDVAQPAIRRGKRVVITEGYTDVLACQRIGIEDAVAALGTAFTLEHAKLCGRFAQDVVILLDSDAAGERASREAAETCISAGLKTLVAPLPAGDDPDSIVLKNGQATLELSVKNARPAVEHFIERAFADTTQSIEDKVRAAEGLWPLLKAMGQSLEKDLYLARLAEKVGVSAEQLEQRLIASEPKKPEKRERFSGPRGGDGGGRYGPQGDGRGGQGGGRFSGAETDRPGGQRDGRFSGANGGRDGGRGDDGPPVGEYDGPPLDDGPGAQFAGGPNRSTPQNARPAGTNAPPRPGPPPKPAPPPKPKVDAAELAMLAELLLYPTLRERLAALIEFASEPMRHILEDLAASNDPPGIVLARHAIPERVLKRAGAPSGGVSLPAASVVAGADPTAAPVTAGAMVATEDADYAERASRTFDDIVAQLKRRSDKAQQVELMRQLKEAEARGDDVAELQQRMRDLKLRARRQR